VPDYKYLPVHMQLQKRVNKRMLAGKRTLANLNRP